MKAVFPILIFSLALTASWACADLPKKAPVSKYRKLIEESPFTSKPPPVTDSAPQNPLENYVLGGVSPIAGGYRVTLFDKKKPAERITVCSDEVKPSHGFKILEVHRKAGDPLGTTVKLSSGSLTGVVAFDESLLTLAAAKNPAQANPRSNQPGAPPQAVPANSVPRVNSPPVAGAKPLSKPNYQPGIPAQGGTAQPRPDHRSRR